VRASNVRRALLRGYVAWERLGPRLWKVYAWGLLLARGAELLVGRPYIAIYAADGLFWGTRALEAGTLLGLFLYAYRRPFLTPFFWKVWWIVYMYFFGVGILIGIHRYSPFWINSFVLALPEYIGVFLYAFRAREIWGDRVPRPAPPSAPAPASDPDASSAPPATDPSGGTPPPERSRDPDR